MGLENGHLKNKNPAGYISSRPFQEIIPDSQVLLQGIEQNLIRGNTKPMMCSGGLVENAAEISACFVLSYTLNYN